VRPLIGAAHCTVEYDNPSGREAGELRGKHAIAVVPFPEVEPDSGVMIAGTLGELRVVVYAMARLLDDLEDE
jgi:hypothetical protein